MLKESSVANKYQSSNKCACRKYFAYLLISRCYSSFYNGISYRGICSYVYFFIDERVKEKYASYEIFCLEEFLAYE